MAKRSAFAITSRNDRVCHVEQAKRAFHLAEALIEKRHYLTHSSSVMLSKRSAVETSRGSVEKRHYLCNFVAGVYSKKCIDMQLLNNIHKICKINGIIHIFLNKNSKTYEKCLTTLYSGAKIGNVIKKKLERTEPKASRRFQKKER